MQRPEFCTVESFYSFFDHLKTLSMFITNDGNYLLSENKPQFIKEFIEGNEDYFGDSAKKCITY